MVATDFSFEFVRTVPIGDAEAVPAVTDAIVWDTRVGQYTQTGITLLAVGDDLPYELGFWNHTVVIPDPPVAAWVVLGTGTLLDGVPSSLSFNFAGARIYVRSTATTTSLIDLYASLTGASGDSADVSAAKLTSIDATLTHMDTVLGAVEVHVGSIDTILGGMDTVLSAVEGHASSMDTLLGGIDTVLGSINGHVGTMDTLLGGIDTTLDRMDTVLGLANGHLNSIDTLSGAMNVHLNSIDTLSSAINDHVHSIDSIAGAINTKLVAQTATTPADAAANALLPTSVSRVELYNGTTWDLAKSGYIVPVSTYVGYQNVLPMGKYNVTEPVLTDLSGVMLQLDSGGALKTTLRSYDPASGANKSVDVAPMNMQTFDFAIATTNQAAQQYPSASGASTAGLSDYSFTGAIGDAAHTSVLTLEVSNIGGSTAADWMAIKFYDNMTGSVVSNITAASVASVPFAFSVDNLGAYAYWRLNFTTGDAASNAVTIYVHAKPV